MSDTEDKDGYTRTYALRITERAQRDVDAATVYLAETASSEIAVVWREGVYEVIASLATLPRRCPLVPEKFRAEVRQLLYRRPGSQTAYRILFSITGEQEQSPDSPKVIILHVRHAATRPITRAQIREIESGSELATGHGRKQYEQRTRGNRRTNRNRRNVVGVRLLSRRTRQVTGVYENNHGKRLRKRLYDC